MLKTAEARARGLIGSNEPINEPVNETAQQVFKL